MHLLHQSIDTEFTRKFLLTAIDIYDDWCVDDQQQLSYAHDRYLSLNNKYNFCVE